MSRSIREELKRAFDRMEITYEELGKRLGISKSSAYKKLNGDQGIDLHEVEIWARVLGIDITVSQQARG